MTPAEAGTPDQGADFREPYRRDLDFCPTCTKHLEECECGMTNAEGAVLPPAELDAPSDRLVGICQRLNDPHWKWYGNHPQGEADVRWLTEEVERVRALLASDAQLRAENERLREEAKSVAQAIRVAASFRYQLQGEALECFRAIADRLSPLLAGEGHPKEGNDALG